MAGEIRIGGIKADLRLGIASLQTDVSKANALLGKVQGELKKLTGSFDKAFKLGAAAIALGGITTAVKKFSEEVGQLAKKGEDAQSIEENFNRLGGTSTEIDKAKVATLGLVDSFDLMKEANRGLIAGFIPFKTNFSQFADLAGRFADATGGDAKQALDKLTGALSKAKSGPLREFGFQVNANKDRTKVWAQVMEQLPKVLERFAPLQDSVANSQQAFNVRFEETQKLIGIAVNNSQPLTQAWRDLAKTLDAVNWKQVGEGLANLETILINLASSVLPSVISGFDNFARGLDLLFGESRRAQADRMAIAIDDYRKEIEGLQDSIKRRENPSFLDSMGFAQGPSKANELADLNSQLGAAQNNLAIAEKEFKRLTEAVKGSDAPLKGTVINVGNIGGRTEDATKKLAKLGEEWDKDVQKLSQDVLADSIRNAIDRLDGTDFNNFLEQFKTVVGEGIDKGLKEKLDAGIITPDQADKMKNILIERAANPYLSEFERKHLEINKKIADDLKKSYEDLLQNVNQIASAFDQITQGIEETFGIKLPEGVQKAVGIAHGILDIFNGVVSAMDAVNGIMSQITDKGSALNQIIGLVSGYFGGGTTGAGGGGIVSDIIGTVGGFFGFAKGGVVDSPTFFNSGNKLGVTGEAGPEAILPLKSINGKLGVEAHFGGETNNHGYAIHVDARGAEAGVEGKIISALMKMEKRVTSQAIAAVMEARGRGRI